MAVDGTNFSCAIPANDNTSTVHRIDWSERAARATLKLDGSEFVFKDGTTWSPHLLKHRAGSDAPGPDPASEPPAQASPIHWPRPFGGRETSGHDDHASTRQFASALLRGLAMIGVCFGLEHILSARSNEAVAAVQSNEGSPHGTEHAAAGLALDRHASHHSDEYTGQESMAVTVEPGSQAAPSMLAARAALIAAADEPDTGDSVPFAPYPQSHLADAARNLIPVRDRESGELPAPPVGAPKIEGSAGLHIQGTSGDDVLVGSAGDDVILGGAGNDTLVGLGGDDLLDGGAGADRMIGGAGDDTYIVDDAGDTVIEASDQGNDTVETTLSEYRLTKGVENLYFTGDGDFTGYGNAGSNVIVAGDGDDRLYGDDVFENDNGDHREQSSPDSSDVEESINDAATSPHVVEAALAEILGSNEDPFEFVPAAAAPLPAPTTPTLGTSANDQISGKAGANDLIYGGIGNDAISGGLGLGRDTLDGGNGNDSLDGGSGNDELTGGMGNDSFYFRIGFGNDVITDFSDVGGNHDVIIFSLSLIDGYDDLDGRIQQSGDDVLITITDHDTITLQNFQMINLSVHDHFQFA